LPIGWNLIPTEQLLELDPQNGVSPNANTQPPGIPTFSIAAIRDGAINLNDRMHIKFAQLPNDLAEFYQVATGDVLIVRGNANPELVGKAGMIRDFPDGCIYPDITKRVFFKINGEYPVLPEYAVLVWNHSVVHNQVLRRAKTSNGTLKINNRDVKQIVLPVPPKTQQEQLVELTLAADNEISMLGRMLTTQEQLKRSLMHDLLTGKVRVNDSLLAG
jgi:type I restriction enzyme S subunit